MQMSQLEKEWMGKTENILFAAGEAVLIEAIAQEIGAPIDEYRAAVEKELARRKESLGLLLVRIEDSLQLCTRAEYAPMLFHLLGKESEEALSRAMLETLSIIAYKQPITRAEIEQVRGVNTSYVLTNLLEKSLIYEAGRKEALGRPILYATTPEFLRHFGIEDLSELPKPGTTS